MYIIAVLILLTLIFIMSYGRKYDIEQFYDQTTVPAPAPAGLSWEFRSPKSNIHNFNETTAIHQDANVLKPYNSSLIGKNQQFPKWIYPYTYINRRFDHILINLVHKIEKDFNNNIRLNDRNNKEWRVNVNYTTTTWHKLNENVRGYISDILWEINRRFNTDVSIVDFRRENIKIYQPDNKFIIIKILVYKKYTFDDIKYFEAIDPNINEHLKFDFEKELLIYIDDIDAFGGYHIKYLRFPNIDYEKEDTWDDKPYVGEYDTMFYVAKSKDPFYRMMSNTEAREEYISKIKKDTEGSNHTCFPAKLLSYEYEGSKQIDNQTTCELANGIWEKKCEHDTDCPYFNINKNYPNTLGGCNKSTGYCQFPVGVNPLTYKRPANPNDAYCYNCPIGFAGSQSIGKCCKEQEKSNMRSPDYMFYGDLKIRNANKGSIENNGLIWSKYV